MRYNPAAMKLPSISGATEGYLAADLELLVDRAIHSASIRYIKAQKQQQLQRQQQSASPDRDEEDGSSLSDEGKEKTREGSIETERQEELLETGQEESLLQSVSLQFEVMHEDFVEAQKGFTPSALKGIKLQKSEVSWDDIGGTSFCMPSLRFQPLNKTLTQKKRFGIGATDAEGDS